MQTFTRKRDFKAATRKGTEIGPVVRGGLASGSGTLVHHIGDDWNWRPGQGVAVMDLKDHICLLVGTPPFSWTWLMIPKGDLLHWGVIDRASIPTRKAHGGALVGALLYGPIGAMVGSLGDTAPERMPVVSVAYEVEGDEHAVFFEFGSSHGYYKMHDFLMFTIPGHHREVST